MKIRNTSLVLLSLTLGTGVVLYFQNLESQPPAPEIIPETQPVIERPTVDDSVADIRSTIPEPIEPVPPEEMVAVAPEIKPMPPRPNPQQRRQIAHARYWEQVVKNFDLKWAQLEDEQNPARRKQLIQSMARNVRMDTLTTLDWAMSLQDPAEQQAALLAINQNALTGIGARIEMDESGYPKIRDTTILSAIDSTGLIEAGDYISGIVNADGSTTSLKGRPIREIVKLLRGKPGTEVYLQMERPGNNNQPEPTSFDVPVLRSLIVIQPPF
ncbi:MAG: hypothetical protein V3V05_06980 [Pontiella sp.]